MRYPTGNSTSARGCVVQKNRGCAQPPQAVRCTALTAGPPLYPPPTAAVAQTRAHTSKPDRTPHPHYHATNRARARSLGGPPLTIKMAILLRHDGGVGEGTAGCTPPVEQPTSPPSCPNALNTAWPPPAGIATVLVATTGVVCRRRVVDAAAGNSDPGGPSRAAGPGALSVPAGRGRRARSGHVTANALAPHTAPSCITADLQIATRAAHARSHVDGHTAVTAGPRRRRRGPHHRGGLPPSSHETPGLGRRRPGSRGGKGPPTIEDLSLGTCRLGGRIPHCHGIHIQRVVRSSRGDVHAQGTLFPFAIGPMAWPRVIPSFWLQPSHSGPASIG